MVKVALAGAAALAVPTLMAWAAFPPQPGPENDVPVAVGLALVVWWAVVSAIVASELAMRRWSR